MPRLVTLCLRVAAASAAALLITVGPRAWSQTPPRAADVVALTVCVIDADIRSAAIVQWQRGAVREEVLRAAQEAAYDKTYRAQVERLVHEIYRAQPQALRPYVAERLQRCVSHAAEGASAAAADGCYQLTRYAQDVFAAREAGVALPQTIDSLKDLARREGLSAQSERQLAAIAARVYDTQATRSQFRSALFYRCVMPGAGRE